MSDCSHFSLRFNYDKPEHRKIIDALDGIDRTQYSSKTHFIICALEHYIEWISLDDKTRWALEKEKMGDGDTVTKKDLAASINALKAELRADMYDKILQCMSPGVKAENAFFAGISGKSDSALDSEEIESADTLAGNLSQYAGVMDSVMSWSDDG